MRKAFPTLAVVGAYTGIVLEDRGFGGIHEVFDFFYPGIMTLGVASMSDNIKELLIANRPDLKDWSDVKKLGWQEFARAALEHFGPTIELESSGRDANFDGLARELEYIRKHRPDVPVVVLSAPAESEVNDG
jgi:hypothetical protein